MQVHEVPFGHLVGARRAAGATNVPRGIEHEVPDDQLRPTLEEVEQRRSAVRVLEHVLLLDLHHGEAAPIGADPVPTVREVLLLLPELLAGLDPFISGCDLEAASCPRRTRDGTGLTKRVTKIINETVAFRFGAG